MYQTERYFMYCNLKELKGFYPKTEPPIDLSFKNEVWLDRLLVYIN